MEIPCKRRSKNLECSTTEKNIPRRKVSNPISIANFGNRRKNVDAENIFCNNSRNSALVGNGDEESGYILLSEQSTKITKSQITNFNNANKTRKSSAVLVSRPFLPLNLTKKKKSSSGVSSSSDDSNFQHQLDVFQDAYRKRSDESLEEISSLSSSPQSPKKVSRDDGKKKIDLGYCSPKISKTENFHTELSKKLSGNIKKDTLIGMFEQISTAGIQESKNSIYEFRKNKRKSAVSRNLHNKQGDVRKRLSMPNPEIGIEFLNNENKVGNDERKSTLQNSQNQSNPGRNRRRAHSLTPLVSNSDSSESLTGNTEVCQENSPSETSLPSTRKSSSNAYEPRRRVSLLTLDELNIGTENNEIQVSGNDYHRNTSKELSELLSFASIQPTDVPKRRFSFHIPPDIEKITKPKRRFSSVLHYVHNESSNSSNFQELRQRFSESISNDKIKPSIDEVDERMTDFVSTIDKSNNMFVAQIENEKLKPDFAEDNSDNNDSGDLENSLQTNSDDESNIQSSSHSGKNISRRFSCDPPHNSSTDWRPPLRKNNSLNLQNRRRVSLTALQNIPWDDKRLSREMPHNRQNAISECAESIASSKDCSSDSTVSTISSYPWQSHVKEENINPIIPNVFTFPSCYDDEEPVSPECRMSARSISSPDELSSGDESDADERAIQRPSVIYRPLCKVKKEVESSSNTSSPGCNYRTLREVDNRSLGIRKGSIASSIDSEYPEHLSRSRTTTQTSIDEPEETPVKQRRRKYGITHITSLENLPKRRISMMQEYSLSDRGSCDEQDSYSQSNDGSLPRKYSTYGPLTRPLVTFQEEKDTEVLSDQKTIDVIFDSLDALSNVENSSGDDSGNDIPFPSCNSNQPFGSNNLPNLDEELEFDSPSWCLERKRKQLGIFKEGDDNIWTPSAENTNSFFNEKERPQSPTSTILEREGTKFSAMFGYFNYFLYVYMTKEYGMDTWKEITKGLGLSKVQREMFEKPRHSACDDNLTDLVLKTTSTYLQKNFNLFLQSFGIKYFEYCSEKYGDILKSIATNLTDFINNMNDIRRHIHKIEKIPDDFPPSIHATHDKNGTLLMYYKSSHEQMEYFMIGFIKRAAFVLFGMRSRISLRQHKKSLNDYSIISIKSVASLIKKPSLSKLQLSNRCKDLILEPYLMDQVFPFHIILNDKLEIVQLGHSLNRYLENFISTHGLNFHSYFKLDAPMVEFSFENVRRNLNTAFVISLRREFFPEFAFLLKGQFVYLDSSKCLWFMSSPKVDYVYHLNSQSNLYLSDIPLHDVTREVLLVGEQKHSVETLKTQLQILTNRLKETSKELALGKINTENILDQMFPKDVADKLMRDLPVPAVTTKTVSTLFTDIVGFTAICEQCDPEEVTVMLNKLYIDFDYLCEKYEIYKVETIGDAYMAVGGLHQTGFDHGRWVTAMGVEMIRLAKNVNIPRTLKNVEIRVGIHSGPVVAGVVGTLMPRYCLFGKNVTLANKMESTSESGKVHISPATYLEIKHHLEFIFWARSREHLPDLMAKSYDGHSFFVSQRRNSGTPNILCSAQGKRRPYMMESRPSSGRSKASKVASRKNSRTESVSSEVIKSILPEELKIQLDALDKINRFDNGQIVQPLVNHRNSTE